jgi:GT2 family glycosyltransferase/MoaA/NifB/PqqE/SkfB family radical SAM enzyme/Tfp pilus assembly protein PilF/glycosyltransferase involved in cell wall biosynthesis
VTQNHEKGTIMTNSDGTYGTPPHTVHFLLNDKCNAKCVFCGGDYYRSKSGKAINLDKFTRMAENLHLEHFRNICLAGAGDPLLNPDFMPIVRHTNEFYPNIDITVTTNGIALKPELSAEMMTSKVSLVNISINAATRSTYKRLMQVDQFDRVCANAAAFVQERNKARKPPLFQLSFAISRLNIEELPAFVELARQLEVRHLNIFYCRFYPKSIRHMNIESTEYLLDDKESLFFHQELSDCKVLEAKALAGRYGIFMAHEPLFQEKGSPKKCIWPESELLVGFEGEVYPCGGGEVHFKKKVESGVYSFGNALTQRIEDFWNNDTYRNLRISCRRGAESPIIECRYCANLMQHDDIRSHIMEWDGFEEEKPVAKPTSSHPLVSVIVPTFNRPDMLPDTLRSILDQTYPYIEIVVVNDAGKSVERLVKEVAPNAVYISHERNKGLAGARNTGIRQATGKYIAYLDDDDIFYPEHIETLVTFLEESDCKVAYTDAYRAFQSHANGRYEVVRRELAHGIDFNYDRILVDNFVPVLCFMHEKGCIEESGYFDENLPRHEDWDLWIRMSRKFRFSHIPKVTCEFSCRVDGSGMSTGTVPMFLVTKTAIYAKYRKQASLDVQRRQRADMWEFMRHLYTFLEGRIEPLLPLFTDGRHSEAEAKLSALGATGATHAQLESALANQRAIAYLQNGSVADAVAQLERAVTADGMNPIASHNLAAVYRKSGQSSDAEHVYRMIVERNESEVMALTALAELATERGDTAEARERYEQVLAIDAEHSATGSLASLPLPGPVTGAGERLKVAVYSLDHPEHACAHIRLIAPAEILADSVEFRWGVDLGNKQGGVNTALIAWSDLIIVQRFFPMANTSPLLECILASGKPVIYETDDLLVEVPTTNPHQKGADAAKPYIFDLIAKATAVTVSTEEMKNAFTGYHRQIQVIPNLLDDRLWTAQMPTKPIAAPVVIGYAGTPDHKADLVLLEEVLDQIAAKYGNRVAFSFMGCDTERIRRLPGFSAITFEPGYENYAKTIQKAGIDIGLVPLADNRFNRCKSNIKWLEYSACGFAGIYSDLPPYRSCVKDGETGILVAGYDVDTWVAALERLIDNPDLRHSIALAARTEVLTSYTLKSRGHFIFDTWRKIAAGNINTAKEQIMNITQQSIVPNSVPGQASKPLISIIIPLYNKVEYTKQCMDALSLNTEQALGYEVILVDNASTDGTAEYLRNLAGEVTIITNLKNLGFAKACNQGGRLARGRYLVFLNNDTIPHPGWLDALIRGVKQESADIVGAKLLYPNGRVQHAGVAFDERGIGYHIFNGFTADHPAVNRKRFMQCVTAACMLIGKDLFDRLRGFDENFINGFEDVDLCLRAGELDKQILYNPESVLIHFEETSDGRKTYDYQNATYFLNRWKNRVICDEDRIYAAEGFMKEARPDGKIALIPLAASMRTYSSPLPSPVESNSALPDATVESGRAGKEYKEKGDFQKAFEAFSRALELGDSSALAEMGDCLTNMGRIDEALSQYDQALRLDRTCFQSQVGIGVAMLLKGDFDASGEAFAKALELQPENSKALCGFGMTRYGQGFRKAGSRYFVKALDADPENITALNQLIKSAYDLQEFNDAIARTRNYLMYHPGDLDILFAFSGILYKSGEFEEAQDSLERLMSLSPEYEGAKEFLSKILTERSQLYRYVNKTDSKQQQSETSETHIEQGRVKKTDGKFAEAFECFSKARKLGDLSVFSDMGDCKANLGDYSEAERLYEEGLRNDPENTGSLVGQGIVRLLQGKHVKAVTSFNKALKLEPTDTKALCGLGMVRNVQGKQKEALECFSCALDADPENLPALHELVKCAYGLKRFEEAEKHLTTYLMYHPGDLDMQFSLAGVRFSNEKYHDALENIDNLLAFDPDFTGGEELRGKIKMQLAANS